MWVFLQYELSQSVNRAAGAYPILSSENNRLAAGLPGSEALALPRAAALYAASFCRAAFGISSAGAVTVANAGPRLRPGKRPSRGAR